MQWKKSAKLVAGIMTMLCATAFIGCGTNSATADTVVMMVDTQEITKEEYQMILSDYVAGVKSQYTTKEANQDDFWESEFESGTPLTEIMELAKEELVYKKVLAGLASEQGSETVTSYGEIKTQLAGENSERSEMSKQNQVVYGLLSYELADYYDYVYSGLENEVVENIKADISISEEDAENYYKNNAEAYKCSVRVETMIAELYKESGVDFAYEVAEAMQNENSEEALETLFPDVNFYPLMMSDLNKEEGKSGAYMNRWIVASTMQSGEICEPFEIGDHIMTIRCIKREENVLQPFEDVKIEIENHLLTGEATEILQNMAENAKVVYDEQILEQITLETLQK